MNKKRGFTLIELLVVVAIIGILASLSLASLTKVKRDARNKRRMSDILQIMTALNLYNDGYQSYPIDNNDGGDSDYSHLPLVGPDFISGLEPHYLSKTPLDPLQDSGTPNLVYKYTSDVAQLLFFNSIWSRAVKERTVLETLLMKVVGARFARNRI